MNILAVCHSDSKSQASDLKKCKFEKCKWCYPNMQPYVHNTHIFWGKICKDFYHRIVSQNGGDLVFYSIPKKMVRYSNYVSKFPTHIRVEKCIIFRLTWIFGSMF